MPVSGLHERYVKQIDAVVNQDSKIGQSYLLFNNGPTQRVWMVPHPGPAAEATVPGQWDYNVFHLSGANSIIAAFDRTQINKSYVNAMNTGGLANGGRIADVKSDKSQLHWVAGEERALTLKYASPIRSAMHSATRRRGHGNVKGIFGVQKKNILDTLAAGYGGGPVSGFEGQP